MVTITLHCRHCESTELVRYGQTSNGKQRYLCHACGKQSRDNPGCNAYAEERVASATRRDIGGEVCKRLYGFGARA